MTRRGKDGTLARLCQEVSGAKYTLLLRVVRELDGDGLLPPGRGAKIETVLRHAGLWTANCESFLRQARELYAHHSRTATAAASTTARPSTAFGAHA